jgi:hypothetical protein
LLGPSNRAIWNTTHLGGSQETRSIQRGHQSKSRPAPLQWPSNCSQVRWLQYRKAVAENQRPVGFVNHPLPFVILG